LTATAVPVAVDLSLTLTTLPRPLPGRSHYLLWERHALLYTRSAAGALCYTWRIVQDSTEPKR